jgi:hypothetical protein
MSHDLHHRMSYVDPRIWAEYFKLASNHIRRNSHAVIRTFCAGSALRDKHFTPQDVFLWEDLRSETAGRPKHSRLAEDQAAWDERQFGPGSLQLTIDS